MSETRPGPTFVHQEARAFVELFALCGLAVAQPLLDLFGRAPHQFAFRGAEGVDIALFAIAVVLVPPVALWLIEVPVGLASSRARRMLHLGLVTALAWAVAVQAARPLTTGTALMVLAVLAAAGFAVLYQRVAPVRMWLAFLALAPIAFAALFLLASPAARLLGGDRAAALAPEVGSPVPVVVVVLDELPLASIVTAEGGLDRDLFPGLGRLAERSHWFRNATTVHPFTWHAVPAIATGRAPRHATAPFVADHPENLFTLLAESHRMNVVESVTRLCPTNLCTPFGGRADLVGDAIDVLRSRLSWSGPSGDPVAGFVEEALRDDPERASPDHDEHAHTERFGAFLDGVVDRSLTLHYLHILLPHQPLRYLPSGRTYDGPDPDIGREGDDWGEQAWPTTLGRQRHLLQLAFTDALIGQLLDRLDEVGLFDEALVILTADHGIAFEPGGPVRLVEGQALDDRTAAELAWVPLFVKLPGQDEATVSDANVLTLDVLPTIAEVLELELPGPVDGRSLLGPPRTTDTKPFWLGEVRSFGIGVTEQIDIDGPAGLGRALDLAVDRFLPAVGDPLRLWRIGPSPELVGTSSEGLPLVEATLHETSVEAEPATGVVPALVRAHLDGEVPGGAFAVAVNGVVGATAISFEDDGRTALAAMVSDELFRSGANEITFHRLG